MKTLESIKDIEATLKKIYRKRIILSLLIYAISCTIIFYVNWIIAIGMILAHIAHAIFHQDDVKTYTNIQTKIIYDMENKVNGN